MFFQVTNFESQILMTFWFNEFEQVRNLFINIDFNGRTIFRTHCLILNFTFTYVTLHTNFLKTVNLISFNDAEAICGLAKLKFLWNFLQKTSFIILSQEKVQVKKSNNTTIALACLKIFYGCINNCSSFLNICGSCLNMLTFSSCKENQKQ